MAVSVEDTVSASNIAVLKVEDMSSSRRAEGWGKAHIVALEVVYVRL